jgi:hypothetical protein
MDLGRHEVIFKEEYEEDNLETSKQEHERICKCEDSIGCEDDCLERLDHDTHSYDVTVLIEVHSDIVVAKPHGQEKSSKEVGKEKGIRNHIDDENKT